jgi:hypothetical protein
LFIRGEEYYLASEIESKEGFDFEIPWCPALPIESGKQVVPFEVIEKHFKMSVADTLAILIATRFVHPKLSVFIISVPPPTASRRKPNSIYEHDARYDLFETRQRVRLKYYLLYCNLMARYAGELNIRFISAPPMTVNEKGFLKDEYVLDGFHANGAYCHEVIKQIRNFSLR